jgi:hypothetical protein
MTAGAVCGVQLIKIGDLLGSDGQVSLIGLARQIATGQTQQKRGSYCAMPQRRSNGATKV